MPSKRTGRRLQDTLDNIEYIERYPRGMNEKKFLANDLVADAVERCLSRISEAARKLGKTAETLGPDEPWPKIRGLGNLLRHDYDIVLRSIIWEIVRDNCRRFAGHAARRYLISARGEPAACLSVSDTSGLTPLLQHSCRCHGI